MANYGTIAGPLSFQGGGGDYKSAYASALSMNQQNYNNILSGYQNTMTSQQNAQGKILVGHQNLESNVLGSIAGIDRSQRQDIADQYAKNIGIQSQDLINRGLGNSTVQSSVGRGLLYDKSKADIALTNSTQGLNAQYMSNLGLARLGYENNAAMQNSAWAGKQLDFMNSVNAAYPDPRTYAMLEQMKGQSGGGGGAFPGGIPGSSGSVKGPNSGGGGYPNLGGVSYANSFGTGGAKAPAAYGGTPETIYPGGAGGNWWDSGTGMGTSRFAENASGLFDAQQDYEGQYAGGNAGGGGFYDPWADEENDWEGDYSGGIGPNQ